MMSDMRGDFSFRVKNPEFTFRLCGFSADLPPLTAETIEHTLFSLRDVGNEPLTITANVETDRAIRRIMRQVEGARTGFPIHGCRGTARARFRNDRWKVTR